MANLRNIILNEASMTAESLFGQEGQPTQPEESKHTSHNIIGNAPNFPRNVHMNSSEVAAHYTAQAKNEMNQIYPIR